MAATAVMAQKKSVINLISSESLQGVKINGVDVLKVYKATFQQDYSTLTSDSAYFHQKENTFDAFGHVIITQGDTLHIYSDKLNYNGNTKIAILTENVRMVDKDATLTTNYLTYNTATRIGTYTGGGKLVNKDNTLTSKNGYYFARSRDSYFRYDVRLVTPDALILTDTMRYNSGSKIAYFYGPTNIYGKKKGKDNDTLYTENGLYNTNTEQAFFGKKNLYRQGTKTLHGDSMFYDRKKGYGRAVKNITFNDTEQKMTLKGDLGTYYKSDERTVVTQHAYAVIVTEEKDTSKNDSVTSKPALEPKNAQKLKGDSVKAPSGTKAAAENKKESHPVVLDKPVGKVAAINLTAITKKDTPVNKKGKKIKQKDKLPDTVTAKKDTGRIKRDSIFMTADSLETRVLTFKDLTDLQEKIRLSHIIDTSKRPPSIVYKKPLKFIELSPPKWVHDTVYLHSGYFGEPKPKKSPPKKAEKKLSKQDSLKISRQDSLKKLKTDSVYLTRKIQLSDTARVRILSAFHHAKIFKSDLQGKSDSVFYSTSDSTIHMFVQPILWTQGSQLSGDTINLQMKNKKLDNMELFPSAFIVNIEKKDSVHFNQVAGKKMRGFFKDGKLQRMYVDGNAETIYFSRDSTGDVKEMQRSLSSRVRINFKDSKLSDLTFSGKPEHRYGPIAKFNDDDKILKGFIWKPKERPLSKESIIHPVIEISVKASETKKGAGKGKQVPGKSAGAKAAKDTSAGKAGNINAPGVKMGKDTTGPGNAVTPEIKAGKDSTAAKPVLPPPAPKDSTAQQPALKPTAKPAKVLRP